MGVADDSAIPFCHAPRFVCRRAQPDRLPIPFWPVAPLLTLLFMGLVIAVLGMFAETRMALIAGLVWLGLLTVVWYARVRKTALQVATEQ